MELEVQLATYVALIRCNEGHCPLVFSVRKDFLIAHFSHYINYIYYLRIDPVTSGAVLNLELWERYPKCPFPEIECH